MKNAVIYTRNASSNEQATSAQIEICREFASAHGYNVVAEFSDNGYSGMNFNRPAFAAMNDNRDQWETLIIHSIDKLSRNSKDIYQYGKTLRDEGKEIVSITAPLSDGMFAVFESAQGLYTNYKGVQYK